MMTTKLSSKGQLVIPKPIREALHAAAGTSFSVTIEGERIVLEPVARKSRKLSDWLAGCQIKRKVDARALCEPVADYRET
jgi:AbrB family looped-hinge helix DNA binding protein